MSIPPREMRKLLDQISRMISYEAYVRGSTDNICTMVISLQEYPVLLQIARRYTNHTQEIDVENRGSVDC